MVSKNMTTISPMSVVDASAQLGQDVTVGPFCVIGPDVILGDGCTLISHVSIAGKTTIGSGNVFYPQTVIGMPPQDLKYENEPTETLIGDGNVFRENVTVHRGTAHGTGKTIIGNNSLFMAGSHIAHDCHVCDRILLGNNTLLAGHVHIESFALITAMVGVNQFVTVGRNCYVSAKTPVWRDVPPFTKIAGKQNDVRGANTIGMQRNGFSTEEISEVQSLIRVLFPRHKTRPIAQVLAQTSSDDMSPYPRHLLEFVTKTCQSPTGRYLELFRH